MQSIWRWLGPVVVALVVAAPVSAQNLSGAPVWPGVTLPTFVIPASAVNGGGQLSTECLTWPLTTKLCEDAANILAQRNGTNAQEFRIYNTDPGANDEYLRLFASSNQFFIRPGIAASGTLRNLVIGRSTGGNIVYSDSGISLNNGANDTTFWTVNTSGHLLAGTDNTHDIGASGATRPRDVFVADDVFIGDNAEVGAASTFSWAGRSILSSPASGQANLTNAAATAGIGLDFATDGVLQIRNRAQSAWASIRMNLLALNGGSILRDESDGIVRLSTNAGTGFTRLILGTNDASGVAWKKNGTAIEARLGGDSAYTDVVARDYTVSRAYNLATQFASVTAPSGPVACTSPTVTWNNGTAAFQIDVGTTCAGISTLVVTLPAVTNAWVCSATNVTTSATAAVEMTASTTTTATFTNYTRTTGVALAWADGADVRIGCLGG